MISDPLRSVYTWQMIWVLFGNIHRNGNLCWYSRLPDHVGCRKIGHIHIRKSGFFLLTKSIPHYTPVEWNYICHLKRHFNKLISITTNDSYREHCKPFTRLVKIKIPNNPPIAYKLEPKLFNRSIDLFWFFQRWIHLPFSFSPFPFYFIVIQHSFDSGWL